MTAVKCLFPSRRSYELENKLLNQFSKLLTSPPAHRILNSKYNFPVSEVVSDTSCAPADWVSLLLPKSNGNQSKFIITPSDGSCYENLNWLVLVETSRELFKWDECRHNFHSDLSGHRFESFRLNFRPAPKNLNKYIEINKRKWLNLYGKSRFKLFLRPLLLTAVMLHLLIIIRFSFSGDDEENDSRPVMKTFRSGGKYQNPGNWKQFLPTWKTIFI